MPNPVDGPAATGAIASLIRLAVSERVQSRQRSDNNQKAKRARTGGQQVPLALADVIAARAEELDPDAPEFRSRMLRLVVEAALLHEFGHALINAPKFQGMVDQILNDLEAAPQLQPDVSAVLDSLSTGLTSRPPGSSLP
ncbi:MAG: hypothetical protein V4532_06745 [Pseudomonadota bacterium]